MLRRKVLSLATVLVSLITSGSAVAQDATTPPPAAPPPADVVVGEAPAATPTAGDKEQTEEIVVTGTRIRRKDLSTPAPVTVISSQDLTSSGKVSLGDFLQTLPEQGNAINTQVNNGGDGTTQVNLRSLGEERTLVLLNGRRFVAGGTLAGSTVDLNSIPTAAIERIEILKDGASAVYGSDAIGGVVNIITKKKMNGSELSAYAGTTSRGDGNTYDVSLTTGTSSEKGNILFSAGFTKQETIWAGDRHWSERALGYDYTTGEVFAGGSSAIPQGRFGLGGYALNPADGGVCVLTCTQTAPIVCTCDGASVADSNSLAAQLLRSRYTDSGTGSLDPANYAGLNFLYDPTGADQIGGYRPYTGDDAYNYQAVNYLVTPSRRIQLFSTGDANIADVARAYFEASYVNRQSRTQIAPDPLFTGNYGVVMSADSIYNPTGVDLFDVRRRLNEFGGRADDYDVTTYRTVFGLDGTLPDVLGPLNGWFWDLSFNWGRTAGTDTNSGALRLPYVQNAVGPSMDPDGSVALGLGASGDEICVSTPGDATSAIDGCVPLNVLFVGGGAPDAAQAAALAFTGTNRSLNQMSQLAANFTGDLFRIADRPVSLALGGEFTKYKGEVVVNPINLVGEGDNYNASNVAGSYDTTQGYAELQIPVLSNRRYAEELEVNLAARVAHYSTFGNQTTYKAGVRYSPIRDVTLRGTFSTAYRAPGVTDLYSGASESFPSVSDPCGSLTPDDGDGIWEPELGETSPIVIQRCAAQGVGAAGSGDESTQLKEFIGGNVDVEPETADIFTLGVVVTPRMLPNFSATVDYFNTAIDNAIGAVGAANILSGCIGLDYGPYCAAITRDPNTHQIVGIDDLTTNFAKLDVSGVDIGLRYALPTEFGRFGFQFNGAYLAKYEEELPSGQIIDGRGNYDLGTNPKFKALAGLTWGLGNFGAGWTTRYIGSFKECMNNNPADEAGFGTGTGGLCYTGGSAFVGDAGIGWAPTIERTISAYYLHDVVLSYGTKWKGGKTAIQLGMSNVFDGRPPRVYNSFLTYADTDYQFAGRTVYARLQQNF